MNYWDSKVLSGFRFSSAGMYFLFGEALPIITIERQFTEKISYSRKKDRFYYITQVSHPRSRHHRMKNQKDFYKIYAPKVNTRLIALVNLNYMFPILKTEVSPFEKSKIDIYRNFSSASEKSKYINLLNSELAFINTLGLDIAAKDIYRIKYEYPYSHLSQRCLDFKKLELIGEQFVKQCTQFPILNM